MKKLLFFLIGAVLFPTLALAESGVSERVTVQAMPGKNTVVVTRNANLTTPETWQLHVKNGCADQLAEGKTITLDIFGELNGHRDTLKTSNFYNCAIDQAERVNYAYNVQTVYNDKTSGILMDSSGIRYMVNYQPGCKNLFAYRQKNVYLWTHKPALNVGDYLVLPEKSGKCQLTYVEKIVDKKKEATAAKGDSIRPTSVRNAKAIPGSAGAHLYWHAATDNKKVSHYLVAISEFPVNLERKPEAKEFSQIATTPFNYITIPNLRNEWTYYFYIKTVDTAGNVSSDWVPLEATPKSSLPPAGTVTYEERALAKNPRPLQNR